MEFILRRRAIGKTHYLIEQCVNVAMEGRRVVFVGAWSSQEDQFRDIMQRITCEKNLSVKMVGPRQVQLYRLKEVGGKRVRGEELGCILFTTLNALDRDFERYMYGHRPPPIIIYDHVCWDGTRQLS